MKKRPRRISFRDADLHELALMVRGIAHLIAYQNTDAVMYGDEAHGVGVLLGRIGKRLEEIASVSELTAKTVKHD